MGDEERVKASLTDTASLVNTLTKQISVEENPFREGGQISKDADEIIDYYRQGKLSVLSQPPPASELGLSPSTPSPQPPSPLPVGANNNTTTIGPPSSATTPDVPRQDGGLTSTDISDSVARDRKNGTHLKEKPGLVQVEHGVVDNGAKQGHIEKVLIPKEEKKCACCVIV